MRVRLIVVLLLLSTLLPADAVLGFARSAEQTSTADATRLTAHAKRRHGRRSQRRHHQHARTDSATQTHMPATAKQPAARLPIPVLHPEDEPRASSKKPPVRKPTPPPARKDRPKRDNP
ncbi:MAG: hypothetical protein DMF64_15725 [Acidobacteria bacterium]|nr:MAG: hypothetical protein DMF64_15725 [Acidobacteriota bacterium]